jgi:hypothetical protein
LQSILVSRLFGHAILRKLFEQYLHKHSFSQLTIVSNLSFGPFIRIFSPPKYINRMKLYGILFALSAFQASAFVSPAGKTSSPQPTALKDSLSYLGRMAGNTNTYQSQAPVSGPAAGVGSTTTAGGMRRSKEIWDTDAPITVQGGSLRTWSFTDPSVERVQVLMNTEGRPLHANVDLWQGPDNTPQKMAVYVEDGSLRQFNAIIETPGGQNAVAIRNTAQLEFPLAAAVVSDGRDGASAVMMTDRSSEVKVQGGAVRTYSFSPFVSSVQVLLKTDGRPLNARVELLQGPNNNKQVVELYTEDGMERPFVTVLETPGNGNVVRIINTAPVEFPLIATVEPYEVLSGMGGRNGQRDLISRDVEGRGLNSAQGRSMAAVSNSASMIY